MLGGRRNIRALWTVWWTFLVLCVLPTDSDPKDPYSSQPKIIVQNGNVLIQSASNHNVSLKAVGEGVVHVNDIDVTAVLPLVRSFILQHVQSTEDSRVQISALESQVRVLRSQFDSISSLQSQVNQLGDNFTALSSQMSEAFGGTSHASRINFRRVLRKVRRLDDEVQTLTTLLTTNECLSNPCRNGGTCEDMYNGYLCRCTPSWEGVTCETDVNECAVFAGTSLGCQNGATCLNTPGSFSCQCPPNYYGFHCSERHDDCAHASHEELCVHGTCVNEERALPGQPKYRCICNPGWQKSSSSPACTQDVDECATGTHRCSTNPPVTCINLPGTFHCGSCPPGFSGDGRSCYDINECLMNNGGCSTNPFVQCVNTVGSRTCGPCPAGYVGDGVSCYFTGVCGTNNGGCHPLAQCIQNTGISGSYRECRCPPGYTGNGEGLLGCTATAGGTSCSSNPCHNGNCQVVGSSFQCICYPGYTGVLCDQQADLCYSSPCQNGGSCVSTYSGFHCICTEEYEGETCSEVKQSCGGDIYQSQGNLSYPSTLGEHYDHGVNCVWVISGPPDKVLNFSFPRFNVEYGTSCEYDYVEIHDGDLATSPLIGRYCGEELHQHFQSTHNQIYLHFRSDHIVSATGFTIEWNATNPLCGAELNVTTHGAINSPGYPGQYPPNRDCFWLVRVDRGKRIQFQFATLQLEHHDNCSFDYLRILDGASETDPELAKYCSTVTPPPVISSGSDAMVHFHSDVSVSDTGFHITYAAVAGIPGCGGLLTSPSGTFTSPNFPDVYDHHLRCEWLIRIHPNDRIELTFTDFIVEYHSNCEFDYVAVYDGESDASNIIGRYCSGSEPPPKIMSNTNKLLVKLYTDYSVARGGFRATYSTVCGGIITDLEGSFHSPYYPDPYPASVTCYYQISLPPGHIIHLNFPFFDIERHYNCDFDSLEIRDGPDEESTSLGKFCGATSPDPITSTYNALWLKFSSDGSVHQHGFYANYTNSVIGCGGVMTNSSGSIGTPSHQNLYPPSITCTWLLRAPPGYVVRLIFDTFALETHANCDYDYVLVQDSGGARIGKYCGQSLPPTLLSTNNEMQVTFVADDIVSREGFNATYRFLDTSQVCGGDYYVESGVIRSPGYPQNYPHSKDCVWVIHAANGHQILLNASFFKLEEHSECRFDYLEIRNGAYASSPLIDKYCGETITSPIPSHSNTMRLEFHSDFSQSAPGFEIYFDSTTTGCGGTLTSPRSQIISPNYPHPYGHNAECTWIIRTSQGSAIRVTIVDLDIEAHATCDYDFLQIHDGSSDKAPSLARLCNDVQIPHDIRSTGNALFIKFRTDFMSSGKGFFLTYSTECNNVLKDHRGVIESPNFPNTYPHNHNCSWRIEAPRGNNISLSFSHLFMENATSCEADYIEVLEVPENQAPTQLAKYCGTPSTLPLPITTGTNIAIVRLITDASVAHEGFRLEWVVKGCGGELTKNYGVITSPNYPHGYPLKTECRWRINYQPGSKVKLEVADLDVEAFENCQFDYLRVYAGEDETAPRLLNLCGKITSQQTVYSHGNNMFIHFYSDFVYEGKGFKAYYNIDYPGCGGFFTAGESAIMSPAYPSNYGMNDDCEWIIKVDPLHIVVLEFYDFDVPASTNCSSSYVAVYDGEDSTQPVLMKHCGGMPENALVSSTGDTMMVRLKADGQNVGKGFRAHYKTGCGSRILADNGGVITSPNYPHLSVTITNCSWILYASEPSERVTLIITHLNLAEHETCEQNSLEIRDGDQPESPLIQKICGRHIPPHITSQGSALHIFLHSQGIFRATYLASTSHCGGTYTSISGSFASPEYPNNYPINTECIWTLSASAGNKILVSFSMFNVEESDYCNMDYVELRENDEGGNLIGRYCGSQIPNNITAAHKVWIKFLSDEIGSSPGFLAHYGLVHISELSDSSGVIESPEYPHPYHGSDTFQWTITVSRYRYVSITFLDIYIPYAYENQCHAVVKVYNGGSDEAPELSQFCGYQIPETVVSHENQVTIKFQAGGYQPSYWKLQWNTVDTSGYIPDVPEEPRCLHEINLNLTHSVEILSPNYPNNYENDYNCTWLFRAPAGNHIELNFTYFNIHGYPPGCNYYDRVLIFTLPNIYVNSWTYNATFCGRMDDPPLAVSENNFMKMMFTTNPWGTRKGFNATARTLCGGVLGGTSGMLNSSEYASYFTRPNVYEFTCEWRIDVRPRRTISISFDSFNIPSDNTCSGRYLLLLNGAHRTSPHLGNGKYCGSSSPPTLETGSNHVFVKLMMNTFQMGSPRFILRYTELSASCGGQIFINTTTDATIETPNYPNPPSHEMFCDWVIMSPAGTRILVEFNDDEFHFTGDCYEGDNMEYVQLFDGGTELSEPLIRYCAGSHSTSPISSGNTVFIRYSTAQLHPGAGIKARVRTAQCGGIITSWNSEIMSPNYPDNYDNNVECEWMIKMRYPLSYYLEFWDLSTPAASDCHQTDYIEIRSESKDGQLIGTYCGGLDNSTSYISLPSYNTYVKFKSNSRDTGKGFNLFLRTENVPGCGGYLEEPTGVITSPNNLAGSTVRRYCHWYIVAPEMRRITVTFEQFNLRRDEETGRCINSLNFYNSTYMYRGLEFCGNEIPGPVDSSSNHLAVIFSNVGWAPGEGFRLSYSTDKEALCGGRLQPPSGIVAVTNLTTGSPNFIDCSWKLTTPRINQTTVFRFNTLDIPGDRSSYCRKGVIYFIGTTDGESRYYGYFCGNMTNKLPVLSSATQETEIRFHANLETPSHGFNFTYNITDCGGVIDGYNATITSPGYPNNYSTNAYCHWILKVPYGDTITVTITDLRMEDDCSKDFLKINDANYYYGSPMLGKFCGTSIPHQITSDSNLLSVKFQTDGYGTAPGFKLTTAETGRGCGGLLHRRQGYVSSPNYPSRYSPNTECEWTVEYVPGSIVNLTFVGRFDIEMTATCDKDYLLIEDFDAGVWIPKEKKCGRERPSNILSSSTKMRFTFHSDAQTAGDGFQIYYAAACGGHFTDPKGTITSLHYPDNYEDNLNCQYILGQPGRFVTLEFEEGFSIEENSDCSYDYITLYRGSTTSAPLIGKYCGTTAPSPMTVNGQILVEFVTDYIATSHGFALHYEISECGGNLTEPYGVISSPKYVEQLSYMYCTWTIFAQENRVIALRIDELSQEGGFRCYGERFEVRESNSSGEYITRLCGGDEKSVVVKSVSSQMFVSYYLSYGVPTAFRAVYRNTIGVNQGCGGSITASSGAINSPDADGNGKYEPEVDCSWKIIGDNDQTVKLTFSSFDLEGPSNGSCIYDYIEVRDGIYSGDPVIGRYCGSSLPPAISSSRNKMTVFFHTDDKENKAGFRSTFSSVPTPCGNSSFTVSNETQTLSSPGYPSSPPANTWCRWRLSPTWIYDRVQIHFTELDVPCGPNDFVEIYTSREVSKPYRICRNASASLHDIISKGDIWVTYSSSSTPQGRGFQLQFKYADCNINFTKDNGLILSPRYPYRYTYNTNCVMTIETAIGRTISLYFGRFLVRKRYASDPQCSQASLKVYAGEAGSNLISRLCGTALPNPIFSTGNQITLELDVGSVTADVLYSISYTTTDKGRGCGGSLSNTNGTFTSPLYPEAYSQATSCVWYLTVPTHHSMTLRFSFYELTSVAGCTSNYIELYEGHTEVQANRIYRLCGNETPAPYNSQNNLLMVKLVTDHTNTAPGFIAHFEMNSYVNAQSPERISILQASAASTLGSS